MTCVFITSIVVILFDINILSQSVFFLVKRRKGFLFRFRQRMKQPPASLLVHPQNVYFFVLHNTEVARSSGLKTVVAIVVVPATGTVAVIHVVVIVVKVVHNVVVLIDVNDFTNGL